MEIKKRNLGVLSGRSSTAPASAIRSRSQGLKVAEEWAIRKQLAIRMQLPIRTVDNEKTDDN